MRARRALARRRRRGLLLEAEREGVGGRRGDAQLVEVGGEPGLVALAQRVDALGERCEQRRVLALPQQRAVVVEHVHAAVENDHVVLERDPDRDAGAHGRERLSAHSVARLRLRLQLRRRHRRRQPASAGVGQRRLLRRRARGGVGLCAVDHLLQLRDRDLAERVLRVGLVADELAVRRRVPSGGQDRLGRRLGDRRHPQRPRRAHQLRPERRALAPLLEPRPRPRLLLLRRRRRLRALGRRAVGGGRRRGFVALLGAYELIECLPAPPRRAIGRSVGGVQPGAQLGACNRAFNWGRATGRSVGGVQPGAQLGACNRALNCTVEAGRAEGRGAGSRIARLANRDARA